MTINYGTMTSSLNNILILMIIQLVMWMIYTSASLKMMTSESVVIPQDVIEEIIRHRLDQLNTVALFRSLGRKYKRGRPAPTHDKEVDLLDVMIKRKKTMVKCDRKRAYKCVMEDWLGAVPRFKDRQFERTFRIKRSLVDYIINNLVKWDSFLLQSIDARNRLSISPCVKFLTAQKMLSYGISFSAFKDYYQMGESTARQCVSKIDKRYS
jgi:hypothetical protein